MLTPNDNPVHIYGECAACWEWCDNNLGTIDNEEWLWWPLPCSDYTLFAFKDANIAIQFKLTFANELSV